MKPVDVEAIRARANAATAGPWEAYLDPEVERYDPAVCANGRVVARLEAETEWDDVQFIAHARQDIPAMLEEIEALRREAEHHRKALVGVERPLRAGRATGEGVGAKSRVRGRAIPKAQR